MKREKIILLIISILLFVFPKTNSGNGLTEANTGNIYKRLAALQCDSLIKANELNPDFVILDVRTLGEWESYHISGSINRSTSLIDFTAQLDILPKHKIFLLHCQSGGRSAGAFAKMKELGFAEVYEMINGISAWKNAALPVTTVVQPRLMLAALSKPGSGTLADTLNITVTNRANGALTFSTATFTDVHPLENNFNSDIILEGAEDYTFSVIHSPGYPENDSTKIELESNGGKLEFTVVLKNGEIQNTDDQELAGWILYPNPATETLYLKANHPFFADEILVFDVAGRVLIRKNQFPVTGGINISALKNGFYMVRIKSGSKLFTKKFLVKH